jgi:hypothetical protein
VDKEVDSDHFHVWKDNYLFQVLHWNLTIPIYRFFTHAI